MFASTLVLLGGVASAQSPEEDADALFEGPFDIDHDKPELKIPTEAQRNAAPAEFGNWLLTVTELAERASSKGEHLQAIAYFRALALAVPDSSAAFRRLCDSHEALQQRARAVEYCAAALRREGARAADYVDYVHLVLKQPEALSTAQTDDLNAVMTHLRTQSADARLVTELECLFALKLQHAQRLEACTRSLQRQSPADKLTIGYEWRLAILRLDRTAAEQAILRARQHGFTAATLKSMEAATQHLMHPWEKALRQNQRAVLVVVSLSIAIAGVWMVLRRRRAQRYAAQGCLQDSNAGRPVIGG